jgi:PST family polysaccharide transporter
MYKYAEDIVEKLEVLYKVNSFADIEKNRVLNKAIYPSISHSKDLKEVKKYLKLFAFLSILITSGVFLLCPIAIDFFLDTNHADVIRITRILCLYLMFSSITPFLGTSILISFGFEKEFNISVILSSCITILSYIFILLFKIYSVEYFAIILFISELFIFSLRLYYCKINKLL